MFKIGDTVRVKSDLKTGKKYNGCCFASHMEVHKGKIGTITRVLYDSIQSRRYQLDIGGLYYFSNDMLDPINNFNSTPLYKVGDQVRIVDEMPDDLQGININLWSQLLGKSGEITKIGFKDSYLISMLEISASFWFPSKYFKKELTSTSENSTENVSKLIEYVPEIELSYCKKQIYTV